MPPQTPTPGANKNPPSKPDPIRNLSEFAVADTPISAGPEHGNAIGGDYLQARFAPMSPHHQSQTPANRQDPSPYSGNTTKTTSGGGGDGKEGGQPTPLERGVRSSGPVDEKEARATRYVDLEDARNPAVVERQNENVDADGKLETYGEGKVAEAVRVKRGTQHPDSGRFGQHAGGEGGNGSGNGGWQGLHGRGRGEVSLEPNEAGLERKKQQQAAARKQVMDARRRGEDVDGRGTAGPSGRQPRAEQD